MGLDVMLVNLLRWWFLLATGETADHGAQLERLTREVADQQRRVQDLEHILVARGLLCTKAEGPIA